MAGKHDGHKMSLKSKMKIYLGMPAMNAKLFSNSSQTLGSFYLVNVSYPAQQGSAV